MKRCDARELEVRCDFVCRERDEGIFVFIRLLLCQDEPLSHSGSRTAEPLSHSTPRDEEVDVVLRESSQKIPFLYRAHNPTTLVLS